ncbi:hypothetical protein BLD25_04640 [Candidatus Gracilibacteria bacterium GN02-872]|nr:hypothetical protein BLD25_04640 [Candidatus Gracilibacteria bacterium GN02-872]
MYISVIIPTGDSFLKKSGSIRFVLLSLLNQSFYEHIEIILVHNGEEVDYVELLKFINNNNINISVHKRAGLNRPQSRNFGALNSSGKYLLFLDDDTIIFDNHSIENIYLFFEKNNFDYGFGATRFWTKAGEIEKIEKNLLFDLENKEYLNLKNTSYLPTGNERNNGNSISLGRSFIASFGIIKNEAFFEIGQFNTDFNSFDDDLLTYELFKSNYNGISLKDFSVIHVNHKINDNYGVFLEQYLSILEQEKFLNYDTINFLKSLDYKLENLENIQINKGLHILGELYGIEKSYNFSLSEIINFLKESIEYNNLKFLGDFKYEFGLNSYTLIIGLAESHISIHTWPENNYLTIDIFVCNYENDNSKNAINLFGDIINFYNPKYFNKKIIER